MQISVIKTVGLALLWLYNFVPSADGAVTGPSQGREISGLKVPFRGGLVDRSGRGGSAVPGRLPRATRHARTDGRTFRGVRDIETVGYRVEDRSRNVPDNQDSFQIFSPSDEPGNVGKKFKVGDLEVFRDEKAIMIADVENKHDPNEDPTTHAYLDQMVMSAWSYSADLEPGQMKRVDFDKIYEENFKETIPAIRDIMGTGEDSFSITTVPSDLAALDEGTRKKHEEAFKKLMETPFGKVMVRIQAITEKTIMGVDIGEHNEDEDPSASFYLD